MPGKINEKDLHLDKFWHNLLILKKEKKKAFQTFRMNTQIAYRSHQKFWMQKNRNWLWLKKAANIFMYWIALRINEKSKKSGPEKGNLNSAITVVSQRSLPIKRCSHPK